MAKRAVKGTGRRPHKWRGRWRAYLTTGYQNDGRPRREYVYGTTEGQCQERLDAMRERYRAGVTDGSARLAAWLDVWLADKQPNVSERTHDLTVDYIAKVPAKLAAKRLDRITPMDVHKAVKDVQSDVSAYTAKRVLGVLRSALESAVALELIGRNPARSVPAPRHEPESFNVWTAEQVARFLRATRDGRCWYYALYYLALTTGARPGELLALTWADLTGDELRVERSVSQEGKQRRVGPTKTRAGRRTVRLPGDALAVLAAHRERVREHGIDAPWMFPSMLGGPLSRANVARALRSWAKVAGVPGLRMHDLRHTFASMLIADGVPVSDVAQQLGHASPAVTLRTYVHFFERAQPRAARSIADLTGADL